MRSLRPTYHIKSFADLPVRKLAESGIRGIAFDLDQTVLEHRGVDISPENLETFNWMARCSMKALILSNANKPDRVERVELIRQSIQERSELEEVHAVVSANVGHRKGHAAIFRAGCQALGLQAAEMAMVDDQVWRGVGGANRGGFGATIKVDPIDKCGNILKDYPMRGLEKVFGLVVPPVYDLQPDAINLGLGQGVLAPSEETI